jgi:hypothetical protein
MKNKTMGIISLMAVMLFAFATTALAGDFKIQSPVGTDIFTVDTSGNIDADGTIKESNVLLSDTYWKIVNVSTPADGNTNLSTADQIFDYIATLNIVANAWNDLTDMTLTDTYIYVGNGTNDPHGVVVSGDAIMANTGALTLDADITRDAEVPAWGYWNETTDVDDDEITEAKIAFSTACAAGNHYYLSGNDLACEADDDTTYTANTPLNLTGTVFDLIDCADTEIYKMVGTTWTCSADTGGIENVVEDLAPQLGGNLDVNDFGIDGGGNTNMTIDGTGNFIIVLS